MATIHQLRLPDTPRTLRGPVPSAGAEIIFFPGVRYERWSEKTASAEKQKRKRRSRAKREKISTTA
jgi:hypothetical protein